MAKKASRKPSPQRSMELPEGLPEKGDVVAFAQLLNGPTTRIVPATVTGVDNAKERRLNLQLMTPNRLELRGIPPMTKTGQWKVWRHVDAAEAKAWGVAD